MSEAAVEALALGIERERPPFATLRLDLRLRNHGPEARWFLLPAKLGEPPLPAPAGVFGVDPLAVEGRGRAVVAAFRGPRGFQALLLPPHADVRLRGFPLRVVGGAPDEPFELEFALASSLLVDGVPPADWVGADPVAAADVDATYENASRLRSYYTPGYAPVPVAVDGVERGSVVVAPVSFPDT